MKHEPTSILAFRNGSIGNTLVAIPALRALRQAYPTARLSVIVDPLGHELLECFPWIDRLILYDKRGKHHSLRAHLSLVRQLRALKPSHAVLFKRFFRNGLLALLSGAPVRAGFMTAGKAPFLNLTIPYDESINIVDLNLKLVNCLGATSNDRRLELHVCEADRQQARSAVRTLLSHGGPYVVGYYGGQTVAPDFISMDSFAELIRRVTDDRISVLLIGAGQRESVQAKRLAEALPHAKCAVGLPIRVSAAVIEGASLFIGLSSGPAHMAAAVNTPSLVILRPDSATYSEERKWLPSGEQVYALRLSTTTQNEIVDASAAEILLTVRELLRNRLKTAAI